MTWCYVILKLVVFDIDTFGLRVVAPQYLWLLDYRFFLLLGGVVLLLGSLGPREFLRLVAFVVAYPIVLLFWKIPKRFHRQWPSVVVFLPALASEIARLWSTFLLYSLAAFASLFILVSEDAALLMASVVFLTPLLVVHLGRSLRKAYSASPLTQLVRILAKLRNSIEAGKFVPWDQNGDTISTSGNVKDTSTKDPRQSAYLCHWFAAVLAEKVKGMAKQRHYDLYLLGSWFYTIVLTTILFAFAYLGLHKVAHGAYSGAEGTGFWSFCGFSFGILTTSNLSKITPVSAVANVVSYAEVVCSVIIFVILVFSILTAAREAFQENLEELVASIDGVGAALEAKIVDEWKLTIRELEAALPAEYVNPLRKLRGLPEVPLQPGEAAMASEGEKPDDEAS